MGCVSSHLLNQDDDFTQISTTSALGHHIVSLTSTTYGLLTLDPSSSPTTVPPTPPPRFTLGSIFPEPKTDPPPEVINSWELMAGLDSTTDSFRFSPQSSKPSPFRYTLLDKENVNPTKDPTFQENPNHKNPILIKPAVSLDPTFQENPNPIHKNRIFIKPAVSKPVSLDPTFQENPNPNHKNPILIKPAASNSVFLDPTFQENPNPNHKNPILIKPAVNKPVFLDGFEEICPPKGENKVVIYTTTLRGVRKTFEACNAVRAVLEGFGVFYCERDISMDRGFKEELWELLKGKEKDELLPPRVFVKGRYVGGSDEVLRIAEDGCLGQLFDGLPKSKAGYVCEVCGGARFLPCVSCNGSCKTVMVLTNEIDGEQLGKTVVVKCTDCNENGLVRCPVCS